MNPIPAAGVLIGVLCGLWMFMMGFTGWYKDPTRVNLFFLVIVIEIAGLIWGLRSTAVQGRTYSGQVVAGTLMAVIAGVIIIGSSLVFTTVAFPDYFSEVNAVSREIMVKEGKSGAEIQEVLSAAAPMQTPLRNALTGFFGTFVTGVIASAIIGVWIRARPAMRS
jgi:hypothetical protein